MTLSVTYTTLNGEILSENRNGVQSDYIPDPLGSTAALIGESRTITDTFSWWPYGESRSHVGISLTPFGFAGTLGYYTVSTGFQIYIRANTLQPSLARWIVEDRLWPNGYPFAYCMNNPATLSDPEGLDALGCAACAAGINLHWAGNAPQHLCRAGYSHCMACCILTANFGAACAETMQGAQIIIGNRDPVPRSIECATGITAGSKIPGGASALGACNAACKIYGVPKNHGKNCIPSQGSKPYPSIPLGCQGSSLNLYPPPIPWPPDVYKLLPPWLPPIVIPFPVLACGVGGGR